MSISRQPTLPPADGSEWAVQSRERFDRRLGRPQLTAIGISGTLGIGLIITSGQLIGIVGSLGTFLAYIIASSIASCVMYTLAEMVAARPVLGALVDFPNTFVSGELGFAVGVTYWIAQTLCMAVMNAATARIADSFSEKGLDPGTRTGLILGLVVITALSNLIGVSKYGQLERVVAIFKLLMIVMLAIVTIGIVCDMGGTRMGGQVNEALNVTRADNFTRFGFVPGFTPEGYRHLPDYDDLFGNRTSIDQIGIPGHKGGRLFALMTASCLAIFSCMGGDQVIITAGESRDPWNDLPIVTQFIYAIPLTIYPLLTLLIGFAINYADPSLYRLWATNNGAGSHSPFIIAAKYASLGALPTVLNALFIITAYTCGNTALYVASRTLFYVCQEYGTPWMRDFFATTNATNTPQKAIIFTSAFGVLGLLGLADRTYDQPIATMSGIFTGTVGCVYVSECWAFIKYKKGLDLLAKRGVFSRDHPLYRRYLFRGHWQPFFAYCGMFGVGAMVIFSGIPSIWLLCHQNLLSTRGIKSAGLIATDLVGAYSGPLLFALLYYARKFSYGSEPRDPAKFTVTHYVLPDTSLFGKQAETISSPVSSIRSGSATAVAQPTVQEMIEQHLQGHGRVFRRGPDGQVKIGRGFWTELSMFIWDRRFPDQSDVELDGRNSATVAPKS